MPTVWARVVSMFASRAELIGVERAAVLKSADLDEKDLADADGRVPLEALYTMLESIVARTRDPLALLAMTTGMDVRSFDALAFVVLTSPTLYAGFDAFLRYQRVFADGERYEMEDDGAWVKIVYLPWGPPRVAHRCMADMFAVDVVANMSALVGAPFDRPRVRFVHSAPEDPERHAALLGVAAEFSQPRNEIWLRRTDLERRMAPDGQEAVCEYFHRTLDARVRALPRESVAGSVRDALVRSSTLDTTLSDLARPLHMSARTLQRRLHEEGTSLRMLLDEIRRARAGPLLEGGQSIAEVAYVLGYAEPSAFHRAFRRWTSETPESYRARICPVKR